MLGCEMSTIVCFEHSSPLPFFGIAMKTDLFQNLNNGEVLLNKEYQLIIL